MSTLSQHPATTSRKQRWSLPPTKFASLGCSCDTGEEFVERDDQIYCCVCLLSREKEKEKQHSSFSPTHRLSKECSLSESLHNKVASMSRTILRLAECHKELQAEVRATYLLLPTSLAQTTGATLNCPRVSPNLSKTMLDKR